MKKRSIALALAFVMVMGTVAAAAGVEKTISVSPMAMTVDGQAVTPLKSDGTPAEVFAYEGATYAPLRYLSELLGIKVNWDANDPGTAKIVTATDYTYADTIAWDGQYDVVVVGFGGAGATAAITAADEGAKVLVLEKAPEGYAGGNTRVCGQMFVYGAEDEEGTYAYYKALAGNHDVPEAMLRLYTKNIAHMYDVMENLTGLPRSQYVNFNALTGGVAEYPEFPSSDKISLNTLHNGAIDGFLWKTLRSLISDRTDKIDVWFESPGTHLIQDPETKTILGVQVEREGKTLNIRANNGVALTTGGFENNPEMVATYLGLTEVGVIGTLYNTGDGIRMAQEVGADLWHMEVYEGVGTIAGTTISIPDDKTVNYNSTQYMGSGASIVVAGDGNRYFNEGEGTRHGHIRLGDAWLNVRRPLRTFIICDETVYNKSMDAGLIPDFALNIQHASSIKELAKLIDIDPDALAATVERYNGYAKAGYDPEFGRNAATMSAFGGKNFYAIEACANILNTQGGPRRNENAEILDLDGKPIPHLYSAGEMGGICAFQYQGGGNVAECIIFGQIAGKNAAAAKEALPAYQVRTSVTSPLTYTPGKTSDLDNTIDVALASDEYLGMSPNGMGGKLYVKVTMSGGKIAKVEVLDNTETPGIGSRAIEALPDAIVKAGSAEVDNVSGATITSKAIKEAVEDALAQVK